MCNEKTIRYTYTRIINCDRVVLTKRARYCPIASDDELLESVTYTQIKSNGNRNVRRVWAFDPFSVAEYVWPLTVAGKPSDVCSVLHASHRDTYICMYVCIYVPNICASSRSCMRFVASNLGKFVIAPLRVRSSAEFIYLPLRSNYTLAT